MSTGFYASASGLLMQQRSLNVLGNNIGNIKTPGFKTERVVSNIFQHELQNRIENGDNLIGVAAPVRIVQDVPVGFDDPSPLEETERPFDMSIDGIGFFNIKTTDSEENLLTRNGNFDIDAEGFLILRGAGRVQGERGDIQVNGSTFLVEEDGTVLNDKGRAIDRLLISAANEGTVLTKARNGLYKIDPNPPMLPSDILAQQQEGGAPERPEPGLTQVETPRIRQGWLEGSNIDLNREMTLMMEVQRNFQSCGKFVEMVDTIDQKTANLCSSV